MMMMMMIIIIIIIIIIEASYSEKVIYAFLDAVKTGDHPQNNFFYFEF